MSLLIPQQRLTNRLSSWLKFTHLIRNSSRKVERGGLDPHYETPYFSMKKGRRIELISVDFLAMIQRTTLTWKEVKIKYRYKKEQEMRDDQRYMPERVKLMGPDIAVAHFITSHGGKLKLKNQDSWLTYENFTNKEVPPHIYRNMRIEAVDASKTNLCYEGFDYFKLLPHLKELILRDCQYIDDWCLHRLNIFESTLEHLDISGCPNITERGICTLHSLKNLKKLVINDIPNIAHKELVCLLLQDIIPQCDIVGVDYSEPSLLNRLKDYLT